MYRKYQLIDKLKQQGFGFEIVDDIPVIIPYAKEAEVKTAQPATFAQGRIRKIGYTEGLSHYESPELLVEGLKISGSQSLSPAAFQADFTNFINDRNVIHQVPSFKPFSGTIEDLGRRAGYELPSLRQKSIDVLRRLIRDPTANVSQSRGGNQQLQSSIALTTQRGDTNLAQFAKISTHRALFCWPVWWQPSGNRKCCRRHAVVLCAWCARGQIYADAAVFPGSSKKKIIGRFLLWLWAV